MSDNARYMIQGRKHSSVSRADLHVHSKYSNRPSEWILRRIGAPECYVEPMEVYESAKRNGMDFVTITDHNSISGVLEIAHLPGTFLSSEMTTYFPENGCKIHCLVYNVNEAEFADIQELRESIYDLQPYLLEKGIAHSIAHPLFSINDKLTVDQVERLLLLFNRFEGINGTRHPRAANLANLIFRNLTREMIEEMADRQGLEPIGERPWEKVFTGGSDDHSGLYVSSGHTVTPAVESVAEFIDMLHKGRHEMGGRSGTSLKLAHSFYQIAYSYYTDRFSDDSAGGKPNLIGSLFKNLLEKGGADSPKPGRFRSFATRAAWSWKKRKFNDIEVNLIEEFSSLFQGKKASEGSAPSEDMDRRSFDLACDVSQQLGFVFFNKFVDYLQKGSLLESLQTFVSLGPVALSVAPYIASFSTQHKDHTFLNDVANRFHVSASRQGRVNRVAWISDSFDPADGISGTIRGYLRAAAAEGREVKLLTCLRNPITTPDVPWKNFTPVGMFAVPECEDVHLAFPPFLEIIEYLERSEVTELLISTPGPLGLLGLAAAKLLGLKTRGVFHVDFSPYVRRSTDDDFIEQVSKRYLQWFYRQLDYNFTFSNSSRRLLIEGGVAADTIDILIPGGGDPVPRRSPADLLPKVVRKDQGVHILYYGRISEDERVPEAFDAFCELGYENIHTQLTVVGDGPLLEKLEKKYSARDDIRFTGVLDGTAMKELLRGTDLFLSTGPTDSFAEMLVEAQSLGVPAIVAPGGFAEEFVGIRKSGMVVDPEAPGRLLNALLTFCRDENSRELFRINAIKAAADVSWWNSLDILLGDAHTYTSREAAPPLHELEENEFGSEVEPVLS